MLAKKEELRLSLFVSIFLECYLSKNRFSPFWVYSQWCKLNLFIKTIKALIFSHIIHSYKKISKSQPYNFALFFVPLQPEEHKDLPLYEK